MKAPQLIIKGVKRPKTLHVTSFHTALNNLNAKLYSEGARNRTLTLEEVGKKNHSIKLEYTLMSDRKAVINILSIKEAAPQEQAQTPENTDVSSSDEAKA